MPDEHDYLAINYFIRMVEENLSELKKYQRRILDNQDRELNLTLFRDRVRQMAIDCINRL